MVRGNKPRHKVAIVTAKDSFFVNGLKSKLLESGIEGVVAAPSIQAIDNAVNRQDPIIYFMGDEIFKRSSEEFLEGLRTMCLDYRRMLILIGDDAEYQQAIGTIPKSAIVEWFSRPVDIDNLLATLQKCYSGKVKVSGKKHILIVDDDTTFMRMMHEGLKDYYRINMLTSGKQAMLYLKDTRPDLILLDYEMPENNGVEVYNMLKDNSEYRDIPIIFLTGIQNKESVINAIDLNPEDYILKSVDRKQLVERLEDFFKKQSQRPDYVPNMGGSPSSMSPEMSEIDKLLAEMNMK
ncbi:MAG: response regulator [Butyrivibrio sp.]|nr:response regulator [Butyrivibrio sp.]